MTELATETPLKIWINSKFEHYQPLIARRVAAEYLRDSHLPCDPQSVDQVLHNFKNLGLMLGSSKDRRCRIRLRRKPC